MRLLRYRDLFLGFLLILTPMFTANAEPIAGRNVLGQPPGEQMKRPYDLRFLDEMIVHHQGGKMMAETAIRKASHQELKNMAQKTIDQHTKEIDQMNEWTNRWFTAYPEHNDRSVEMDMAKFEQLSGNDFDLAYLDSMIMHHPSAIYLASEALQKSSKSDIRALAAKIKKTQIKELEHMRMLRSEWDAKE